MESDSPKDDFFTPEIIAELRQELREHPIDDAYDDACLELDNNDPIVGQQMGSRSAYKLLKLLGELPPELERDPPPQFGD